MVPPLRSIGSSLEAPLASQIQWASDLLTLPLNISYLHQCLNLVPLILSLHYPRSIWNSTKSNIYIAATQITTEWYSFQLAQLLSCVRLFVIPWITACQASLSITNSQSSLKLMSIESVMPSSHLILCRPLLLPPSIFPSTRVFSNESALHIRCPKYWSFGFSVSPSNECSGLISFRMDWFS